MLQSHVNISTNRSTFPFNYRGKMRNIDFIHVLQKTGAVIKSLVVVIVFNIWSRKTPKVLIKNWESSHEKTSSANQLSMCLVFFCHILTCCFYVTFSFTVNARTWKCETTWTQRNNICLEWPRMQQNDRIYHKKSILSHKKAGHLIQKDKKPDPTRKW